MPYDQTQMIYDEDAYYSWYSAHINIHKIVVYGPESRLNRTDGYQVLQFINQITGEWPLLESLQTYHKIERMIKDVPVAIENPVLIAAWIITNWAKS